MPTEAEGRSDAVGGTGSTTESPKPASSPRRTAVRIVKGGPMIVDGPVDIELDDGTRVTSDRFAVAICTCRRSKNYPLCDTSHRTRKRS